MEQFTDAEKARQVLNAARIPDAESLDDGTAAALWDELSWAATCIESYKIVTSKKLKTDQIVHFEEITRLARRLSQLLKNDLTVCRLERFYPDPFHPKAPPNLSEMQRWLDALKVAADKAFAERKHGSGISTPRINSPMEYCVFELARIFEKYVGADPGTSTTNNKKGGPFVRFVHAAAHQFGFQPPAGETIAAALRKRKATPEHSKHVIGRVKFHSR
jgi:hypothetical protein